MAKVVATTRRVLTQLRHDPRSIVLMLVAPSLLVGLFAWLFSEDPKIFDRFGPAILALFPFTVMFLVTSITTLRERKSGTLERLMTMPASKGDFIVGYALAFGLMALVQAVVTVAFAVWVCGLDIQGELWELALISIINSILGTSLGLLASAFAQTEFQAVQFMPLLVFPQMIVGGVFVPRDQMPHVLEIVSDFMPLSYAVEATNAVAGGSTGWDVWRPLLVVVAFAVGFLVLAPLTLRRRTP